MNWTTPKTKFCPFCGDRLKMQTSSRFVECEEHGRMIVNASRVGVETGP